MDRGKLAEKAVEFYNRWMQDPENEGCTWGTKWVLADFALEVLAERDVEEWNLIYAEKDNPTELGWYLVSVLEMNTLGAFRYTDIISFGHRAEIGNCWFIQSDKQRVVAWKSRPDPYKGEQ
jgi:hypothetical protein